MREKLDPEVLADLQLRERTARERPGNSETQFGRMLRAVGTPRVVDKTPCRARCGGLADWTEEAENAFSTFNRMLDASGDAPLDKTKILFCDACRKRGLAAASVSSSNHAA